MKSVISNHETPKESVLERIDDVVLCGDLVDFVQVGSATTAVYMLGDNKYNITFVNGSVLLFELENVYCFKFQKGGKDYEKENIYRKVSKI